MVIKASGCREVSCHPTTCTTSPRGLPANQKDGQQSLEAEPDMLSVLGDWTTGDTAQVRGQAGGKQGQGQVHNCDLWSTDQWGLDVGRRSPGSARGQRAGFHSAPVHQQKRPRFGSASSLWSRQDQVQGWTSGTGPLRSRAGGVTRGARGGGVAGETGGKTGGAGRTDKGPRGPSSYVGVS